jgi:acyl carrier protein
MAMSRDEIYTKVQGVLVDALGVDEDDVSPTATLRGDLGAESIDFLDIVFRLEKAFGIKIPRGELFPEQLDPAFVQDGKLNDAGLAEVRRRMPGADLAELERTRDVNLIANLFSVQDIVGYLEKKVA